MINIFNQGRRRLQLRLRLRFNSNHRHPLTTATAAANATATATATASTCSSYSSIPNSLTSQQQQEDEEEVVIALGSNVGDRVRNFNQALHLMNTSGIRITRHACLYETHPAYVTDQPLFLNSAVTALTTLPPHQLLHALKDIEHHLGRSSTNAIRYGPRPIDLDILFYGSSPNHLFSDTLTIPHQRIFERPFVMAPLIDLLASDTVSSSPAAAAWHSFANHSDGLFHSWQQLGGESLIGKDTGIKRVLPVRSHLWDFSRKTSIMGVLNLTPDSFSDGGQFQSLDAALSQVRLMISQGADIIDFGAQSTRPMADRISPQQELDRLMPVLEAVLQMPEAEGKLLSVDTFYSQVASEAIHKGAHIVNDVSAGKLNPDMLTTVAGLNVPYVAMHMRGDPTTMQNTENVQYDDNVCGQVASELYSQVREAELSGIPAWRIIIDPGLGFSKKTEDNLDILVGLPNIRAEMAKKSIALSHAPLLVGPSRKRFLGDVCGRPAAIDRDPATIAAVTASVLGGANIVRVHNVRDNADAVKLCNAMLERKKTSVVGIQ